jgi:AAA domain
VSYVASLVGKLRDDLMSQKLSVAVITPYKAQVRRLKQALAVVISPDREGEGDGGRDRGDRGDNQKGKKGAVDGGDKRDRGSGRDSGKGGGKSSRDRGKGRGNEPKEEGEEEEEEEEEVPFDCEVNSIDGFQVCSL